MLIADVKIFDGRSGVLKVGKCLRFQRLDDEVTFLVRRTSPEGNFHWKLGNFCLLLLHFFSQIKVKV